MNKLDQLMAIVTTMTGLTFEDCLAETSAETEAGRQEAMAKNVAKMADYMRAQGVMGGV